MSDSESSSNSIARASQAQTTSRRAKEQANGATGPEMRRARPGSETVSAQLARRLLKVSHGTDKLSTALGRAGVNRRIHTMGKLQASASFIPVSCSALDPEAAQRLERLRARTIMAMNAVLHASSVPSSKRRIIDDMDAAGE